VTSLFSGDSNTLRLGDSLINAAKRHVNKPWYTKENIQREQEDLSYPLAGRSLEVAERS